MAMSLPPQFFLNQLKKVIFYMMPIQPTFEGAIFQIQHATLAISYLENHAFLHLKAFALSDLKVFGNSKGVGFDVH